jgi:putative addiction module antidote
MVTLKVTTVGNSVGVVLPKEALATLHVTLGDILYLTEAAGGFRITPYDPNFERQMTAARGVMRRRRNALRELAKR